VVDDNPDTIRVLSDRLRAAGYPIVTANDGLTAVRLLTEASVSSPIRGVLLDVQMPVMDGLEALRWLRSNLSSIPVLMMSAVENAAIVGEARRLGAAGFISKSEEGVTFIARCAEVFGPPGNAVERRMTDE